MLKKELVFVPAPGEGHIVSTLEFAKRLTERAEGLSITILSIRSPFGPASMEAASHPSIQFIDIPQADPPPQEVFMKSIENYIALFIENHKSHVKDAIIDHILSKSVPLAGLVVDMFCCSMIDVANELGVPSYVFFTSGASFLGLIFYLPIHTNQTGREYFTPSDPDSTIPAFANPVPSRVLPSFLFNKNGGYALFLHNARRYKEAKGIFINTYADLEPHAIQSLASNTETPPIYTVGPLLNLEGHKKSCSDREKILKWLNDQRASSVVFLCFGSVGGFGPSQLEQIAAALEQSGHRFLWSIRAPPSMDSFAIPVGYNDFSKVLPEGFLERTENRGLVCGWAPQVEVLAHAAVGGFVSHCGWNSILESIWHGVPIATWPIYAEQQTNAFQLVKDLELAVELKIDHRLEEADKIVMADKIGKAIQALMDAENPVRKRVKAMSDISRKAGMDGGSSFTSIGRLTEDILVNNL